MPVDAKHPDAALDWLTVAASKPGQEAFNPLKGSICVRTDCNQALFSEYLQDAAKDWTAIVVVGNLMHGVVAAPAWATSISTAIGLFQADTTKTADLQAALFAACKADDTCK
jgi:glucose/mannose transport system substrate-binding protein